MPTVATWFRRSAHLWLTLIGICLVLLGACQAAPAVETQSALNSPAASLAAETPTPEEALPPASPSAEQPVAGPTRTARPSATRPAPTPSLTATRRSPSLTPTNTLRPTRTPTITPTPAIPEAAVQFRSPGPLSRLVSPFKLQAYVKPGPDGRVRIELFGEDGRLLLRKIQRYASSVSRVFIDESVEFELPGAAETARLQISTYDAEGRITTLAAQDVLLLSLGEEELNPAGYQGEPFVILEPLPNKLIQGGRLLVSGLALPPGRLPFLVELIAADGQVVGYRQGAAGEPGPNNGYAPFLVDVPYQVEKLTRVRLTIKAYSDGRISGIIYVTSEEIVLSP